MYAFTIADVAYSLVKLSMVCLAVFITEGIIIGIYMKWKENKND